MGFYKNKRVLVTGHSGFKGSWLVAILKSEGAIVTGYSLGVPTTPSLFESADIANGIESIDADVRDFEKLKETFLKSQPEIVFHLAAQPIVRDSYVFPRETYEMNVMGTVNVLECVRNVGSVKSVVNVTTDKVYENNECEVPFKEDMKLDGFDPYSNSKSCSELVTHSYKKSFFDGKGIAVSTARAGNVIGGGDFAHDRIIPDCVRSALMGKQLELRNPNSTRPYQHVLEPLFVYLMIAEMQYKDNSFSGYYNVGPDYSGCYTTGALVDIFSKKWGGLECCVRPDGGPHEANFLKLDCTKLKSTFGWKPLMNVETAVEKVVEWSKCYRDGGNVREIMEKQIKDYKVLFTENILDNE